MTSVNENISLFIGIDFGTTYSGVAWTDGIRAVNVIDDWPTRKGRLSRSHKVPTQLTYGADGKVRSWGFPKNGGRFKASNEPLEWFKPLLEQWTDQPFYNEYKNSATVQHFKTHCPPEKDASSVTADYLQQLWNYTIQSISQELGKSISIVENSKLHVVLGVPAVWSPSARDRMKMIARNAGLPHDIELICEPEAAALAVMHFGNRFSEGSALIICDAGGGTVDLVTYQIDSQDPLKMGEIVQGDGGMYGSIHLNIAFEQHIAFLVGDRYDKISESRKQRMRNQFEDFIKPEFSVEIIDESLLHVDLDGIPDNGPRIRDNTILLLHDDLIRIFQPIGEDINHLIETQVQAVRKIDSSMQINIVLTGGFGDSQYLFNTVQQQYSGQGNTTIIRQKDIGWRAVALGATFRALESRRCQNLKIDSASLTSSGTRVDYTEKGISETAIIQSRILRYSFGIRQLMASATTDERVVSDIVWIVEKGTSVRSNSQWIHTLKRTLEMGAFRRGRFSDEIVYRSHKNDEPQILQTMNWRYLSHKEILSPKNWLPKTIELDYALLIEITPSTLICRPQISGRSREYDEYEIFLPEY